MQEPIYTIFEIGKSRHNEYEAEVASFANVKRGVTYAQTLSGKQKMLLKLGGTVLFATLLSNLFVV
jgi:hypothetical protein